MAICVDDRRGNLPYQITLPCRMHPEWERIVAYLNDEAVPGYYALDYNWTEIDVHLSERDAVFILRMRFG